MKNFKILWIFYIVIVGISLSYGFKFGSWILKLQTENKELHTELIGKKEEYQQLSEYSAKLKVQYLDATALADKLKINFNKEADVLKGKIKILSNATFMIREAARRAGNSDISYQGAKVKYVVNELRYAGGPPIGYVLIFDDGRVVSKLYKHIIDVKTAISRDEKTGKYTIINKADYVLKTIPVTHTDSDNWLNKPFALKIVGGEAFIDPVEPIKQSKFFHWWAPRINAEFSFYKNSLYPGIGISLLGYGYSARDLDFKFLQIGGQYTKDGSIIPTVSPIMWRPFPDFLANTYIGMGASYNDSQIMPFISLQVGL